MRDLKRKDKLVEAAGEAYGKTLSLAVLDVCNDDSVKQCIDGIKGRHVDVLSELDRIIAHGIDTRKAYHLVIDHILYRSLRDFCQ